MGHLHYGSPPASFELDDRTLAHVELVTLAKLRRNESFAMSLDDATGHSTIWLNSSSVLRFQFDGDRGAINRAWLDLLIEAANVGGVMRVLREPGV